MRERPVTLASAWHGVGAKQGELTFCSWWSPPARSLPGLCEDRPPPSPGPVAPVHPHPSTHRPGFSIALDWVHLERRSYVSRPTRRGRPLGG